MSCYRKYSEMFAAFCIDVGCNAGGTIAEEPLVNASANDGVYFLFYAEEEKLNADGSCNEEFGTQLDIAIRQGKRYIGKLFDWDPKCMMYKRPMRVHRSF